jgi:hypothetical protein
MKKIITFLLFSFILTSCQQSKNVAMKKSIDYSNKTVLDSLIKTTSQSNDTLFLGFVFGMTKTDFIKHIDKIRKEGKTITFSNSNRYSTIVGSFDLGAGYTFETSISADDYGKTITGLGKYFIEPIYNKSGVLAQLKVLPIEDWNIDSYSSDEPNWLKNKIQEKYEELLDEALRKALVDNEIISEYNTVWRKGNLLIYETDMTFNYIDLKTLFVEFLNKELEKEIINKDSKDIKV